MKQRGMIGVGEPRSLEFFEFIDTSRTLMDVERLETPLSVVEPVESDRAK